MRRADFDAPACAAAEDERLGDDGREDDPRDGDGSRDDRAVPPADSLRPCDGDGERLRDLAPPTSISTRLAFSRADAAASADAAGVAAAGDAAACCVFSISARFAAESEESCRLSSSFEGLSLRGGGVRPASRRR